MNCKTKLLAGLLVSLLGWSHSVAQDPGRKATPATTVKNSINPVNQNDFLTRLMRRPDSLYFDGREALEEQLRQLSFVSGNVYFSGAGFPVGTIAASITGSITTLRDLLNRCGPGSRITFEKCIFRKTDQTHTIPISKSMFIR